MKRISFGTLAILILCLAAATVIETATGTQYVCGEIYGAWWFIALWAIAAATALVWLIRRKIHRRPAVFLLHLSFLVILSGALLTFLTGVRGQVHLREGMPENTFVIPSEALPRHMPFTISLERFEIACYPGSATPADYISHLSVTRDGKISLEQVSMNNVLSVDGFRFYQTSYDTDGKGTLLSVNHDPWGMPVTYAGYILFGIGMLALMLSPSGGFRRLLRNPLLKGGLGLLAAILPGQVSAQPRTLDKTDADMLGDMLVMYNGRICPLNTLACDFTMKLTHGKGYRDYTPEQILAGWIFYPEEWSREPIISVSDRELRRLLETDEYAPLTAFFSETDGYLPASLSARFGEGDDNAAIMKAITEADEKIQIIRMLRQGTLLTVFPNQENGSLTWHSPADRLPEDLDENEALLIRNLFALLGSDIAAGDSEKFAYTLAKFRKYQTKKAGSVLPSETRIKAEKIYNRLPLVTLLYRINLTAGCILFSIFCLGLVIPRGRRFKAAAALIRHISQAILWCGFAALTAYVALRAYVGGCLPVSNGYETMLAVSWTVMLIAVLFGRGFRLLIPFGLLLSGFTLLVAVLGQMNPAITPLMPVLHSPWLSLHVSVIMVAYALFAFITLNGLTAILLRSIRRNSRKLQVRLMLVSRIFLYPAEFFLGAGIFIGAVWANESWGRYWAWDPKEVWALICFLIYAFPFHLQSIRIFRRPLFFHAFMVVAFLALLMTYFGVNTLLGGMHSYK